MEADIKMAGVLGAAGVVIGCLSPDGTVDEPATKRLMATAKQSVSSARHRATDPAAPLLLASSPAGAARLPAPLAHTRPPILSSCCPPQGLDVTFHRAFDLCHGLGTALDQLISLGVPRVLTSGGCPTAMEVGFHGREAQGSRLGVGKQRRGVQRRVQRRVRCPEGGSKYRARCARGRESSPALCGARVRCLRRASRRSRAS